ncbi:MAG: helix-turn-helix domain-containing protein [Candidatus Cryptobacteroides sp.]
MDTTSKYSAENLPLWGLKKVSLEDIVEIGDFWTLPKSGFFLCRKGRLTIGDHDRFYCLHPQDIIVYPVQSIVYIKEYSPDIEGTICIAESENIFEMALKTIDAAEGMSILANPSIHLDDEEMARIEELASIVERRTAVEGYDSLALVTLWQALCYDIADIFKKKTQANNPGKDRNDAVLLTFLFSIKDHIREHREVQYYAKQQCLSTRYFSTLIKTRSGVTPSELIAKATLSEVKSLLLDPSMSVKEISYIMGFPSPSFFGRWFKHYEGVSPAKFRKNASG